MTTKTISAEQVKKLPPGTPVYIIDDNIVSNRTQIYRFPWYVVRFAKQKRLRRNAKIINIKDTDGKHFEVRANDIRDPWEDNT